MPKRLDINLIPTELQQQRRVEEVRRSFNFVSLAFFIVLAVVSLAVFAYRVKLGANLSNMEKLVKSEQGKIRDLSSLEEDARRLKTKAEAIGQIIKGQSHFSVLLDNLAESTPADVSVVNLSTIATDKIGVSGSAQSYVSLANFILTALDPNFGGKIFSGADLTSVSLDESSGRARFALILYLKSKSLSSSASL